MATIRTRGEFASPGEIIQLQATFFGTNGQPIDLDTYPQISIQQPSGNVIFPFTSMGVSRVAEGVYNFDYTVDVNPSYGVWFDHWKGMIGGYTIQQSFNFVIQLTQMPAVNTDGFMHLGDDVPWNFSQNAICNINKLIKYLKARLNSSGKAVSKDEYGNKILIDCDIYTVDQLTAFLWGSLSAFNQIPHFTEFTFDDSNIIDMFTEVLVQHATIYALASKALIERGREYNITDNGVSVVIPTVSELLNSQWGTELTNWNEKVKLIKQNMKPSPVAIGSATNVQNPLFRRLRSLRERKIY